MTYSFEQAQDEWKRLPFDNVAYINSSDILKKSKDEIKEMISQFEATRYGLSGWRNYENKWRATLGLDTTTGSTIVDYGCGFGLESLQFLKKGNKVYLADILLSNLDAAEYIITTMGYTVEDKLLIKNQYPFIDHKNIDIFYSNGVLHHTPEMPSIVKRAFEVLPKDGEVRLMLYSDVAWTVKTKTEIPAINFSIEEHPEFNKFVRAMDGVGKYADWYNKEKLEYKLKGICKIKKFDYITKGNLFCVAILVNNEVL